MDLDSLRARGSDYLSSLRPNTRQQIRRSMRLYDAAGELSATWADSAEIGLRFLDGLKTLHQNQWNARGKPGGFASAFFERFQRRLIAEALPAGAAELVQITRGDEPIGYLYNLVWQGYVHAFVSGIFFEDDNRLKPGLVCHALCIQHHLDTGASVYDFMAGDFRYKASLGEPDPTSSTSCCRGAHSRRGRKPRCIARATACGPDINSYEGAGIEVYNTEELPETRGADPA